MNTGKITLCLCLALPMLMTGQTDYSIAFHSAPPTESAFFKPSAVSAALMADIAFNQRSYLILQFEDIPGEADRHTLSELGVSLLHYLPNYAYFASMPWNINLELLPGVRTILLPRAAWKLSEGLARNELPAHALQADGIRVQVLPYGDIPAATLAESLSAAGYAPVTLFADRVELTVPVDGLKTLASLPAVLFIAAIDAPSFSESFVGRSQIRSNWLGAGPLQGWNGTGVALGLADDGTVSHVDFKGRTQAHTAINMGTHGDMTAGQAIGGGNINPLALGTAPGAFMHLYHINEYPHISNAVANYLNLGVVITSTSYGDGCGGVYSLSARALDEQVVARRELLHVFSAGNSGQEACGLYGALGYHYGIRYGNITGGRKTAKHALVIANVDLKDSLRLNSSRGPLNDGILKPDLSAPGQGNLSTGPNNTYQFGSGTSAAAPTIAGLSASLYQAYRSIHNATDPSFAHIKTALFNTADDLGRPGPDYEHGWGRPHGGRALKLIQNNWFIPGSVAHQAQNNHSIYIAPGTQQLRVMVYWFDPAATPNAPKTLVNDLDLTVLTPNNSTIRPWVLSKAAHIDSITKPAYRGIDRVNILEQVTLDNPQPGTYQIQIKGHMVPQGPQDYVIAYYLEDKPLDMAYPNGGEGLVPGETEIIRWDALGNSGPFSLDFSIDSMATWQTIALNIPGNKRLYDWTVPASVSGQTFFRIRRGSQSATSDSASYIIGVPDFQISNGGVNVGRMSWQSVAGANLYTIYALGERYMEVIGTTSDTSFLVPVQAFDENWYSVQAGHNSGFSGRRAYAQSYIHLPCQVEMELTIKFDQFPGETHWEIRNNAGTVLLQGGPYTGYAAHSTLTESFCIPYGCYQLLVFDSYNDGLCCQNGEGFYQLKHSTGTLFAFGSQFGSVDTSTFCLNSPSMPLSASAVVQQQVSCYGASNGIASVNVIHAAGTCYYYWSNGATTQMITNLGPGIYTVTVTDGQSQAISSVVITQPQPMMVTINVNPLSCAGNANGGLSAIAGGGTAPYTYAWSSGHTGATVSGLNAGSYSLTVTDHKGCQRISSATITQPAPLALSTSVSTATNGTNGAVSLAVSGGIMPYQFEWSNGGQTQNLSGLAAGLYRVTVTDANNCSATTSATVTGASSTYCLARGVNTNFEWIASVQVGSLLHPSVNNGGYADFTAQSVTLSAGNAYEVVLQPGYAGNQYAEYWRIWIDLNGDNFFDSSTELVFSAMGPGPKQGTFSLPDDYTPGSRRMRIAMKYGAFASPCEQFPYGEVEDYSVLLTAPQSTSYCPSQGASTGERWIESVRIGSIENVSGPNGGYANFSHLSAEVSAGGPVEVMFSPGSHNNSGGEHWRVWIDFNRDGDFDDSGEQVLSSNQSNTMIHATIYLPANVAPGPARMRITLRWNAWPAPCDSFDWGEVEDYTIAITNNLHDGPLESTGLQALHQTGPPALSQTLVSEVKTAHVPDNPFDIFPNPAAGTAHLVFEKPLQGIARVQLMHINGIAVRGYRIEEARNRNSFPLDLRGLLPGVYTVRVNAGAETFWQKLVVQQESASYSR